ncbi:MAG: hypothetical protein AL399_00355 [Candidatus [Bacteroides] periocalifornicus]|uniref:Uncharacterized protein n=1 Tax=Candidatus [Bacteroides] periocalifornicus TaxID=1702214 RepID=A0A0Q4AZS7_9BACT|nr:MAG: hypothetical protein AL399_00085 [Candidatus [Bacteroides] periocalifornicus]KQM09705.1 MAG: hypothetical protein AL399_00355 [Candidatus [Bacteroides] periocalifornicus]
MQWLVVLAVLSWIISAYVKAQKKRKSVTMSRLLEALQEQRERELLQTDELPDEDEEEEPINGGVDAVGRPEHQEYAETLRYEANQQAAAARETGSLGAEPIRAESGEAEGVYTGSLAGSGADYSRWSGVLDRVDAPSASSEPEETYQFTPEAEGQPGIKAEPPIQVERRAARPFRMPSGAEFDVADAVVYQVVMERQRGWRRR